MDDPGAEIRSLRTAGAAPTTAARWRAGELGSSRVRPASWRWPSGHDRGSSTKAELLDLVWPRPAWLEENNLAGCRSARLRRLPRRADDRHRPRARLSVHRPRFPCGDELPSPSATPRGHPGRGRGGVFPPDGRRRERHVWRCLTRRASVFRRADRIPARDASSTWRATRCWRCSRRPPSSDRHARSRCSRTLAALDACACPKTSACNFASESTWAT